MLREQGRIRIFLCRAGAGKASRPRKGQEPAGNDLSPFATRPSRRTGYPHVNSPLTQESVMGIIAWIVLGLIAGLLANLLIPGKRSQGLIITCVIGIAGALLGGWLAIRLFHVHTLNGFFNLSTWLTAIAGAAILLPPSPLLPRRTSPSRTSPGHPRRRRTSWAHR